MSRNKLLLVVGIGCFALMLTICCVVGFLVIRDQDDDKSSDGDISVEKSEKEDNDNSKSKYDACELFTKKDAEEILGAEIADQTDEDAGNTSSDTSTNCFYITNYGESSDVLASIGVMVTTTTDDYAKTSFNNTKMLAKDESEIEKIDLLGDEAFILPNVLGTVQLSILKDDSWILITVLSSEDARQAALDAGEIVLSRMD